MICKICGEELEKYNKGHHFKSKHKMTYLEYREQYEGYTGKDKIFCRECGKEIITKSRQFFCDKKCRNNFKKKEKLIENNKKYEGVEDIVVCKICGWVSTALHTHINQEHKMSVEEYINKFECEKSDIYTVEYLNGISERLKGENNVFFNHGGKYSPFSEKNIKLNEEQRKAVIKKAVKNRTNTSSLQYWLNKCDGDEEKARECLRERQSTFSLEKCIKKYGEEEGIKRFNERQEKWQKKLKKFNYSNISQELFKAIYLKIKDLYKEVYFAILNNGVYDYSGKNYEYYLKLKISFVKLDFYIKDINKCIEFDGDYWHGERRGNQERDNIREEKILESYPDMKIYHVSERDYIKDKEKVVNDCVKFILEG